MEYVNADVVFILYLIFLGGFLFVTFNPTDIEERQMNYAEEKIRQLRWEKQHKDTF